MGVPAGVSACGTHLRRRGVLDVRQVEVDRAEAKDGQKREHDRTGLEQARRPHGALLQHHRDVAARLGHAGQIGGRIAPPLQPLDHLLERVQRNVDANSLQLRLELVERGVRTCLLLGEPQLHVVDHALDHDDSRAARHETLDLERQVADERVDVLLNQAGEAGICAGEDGCRRRGVADAVAEEPADLADAVQRKGRGSDPEERSQHELPALDGLAIIRHRDADLHHELVQPLGCLRELLLVVVPGHCEADKRAADTLEECAVVVSHVVVGHGVVPPIVDRVVGLGGQPVHAGEGEDADERAEDELPTLGPRPHHEGVDRVPLRILVRRVVGDLRLVLLAEQAEPLAFGCVGRCEGTH
jgi:hypothetical protein